MTVFGAAGPAVLYALCWAAFGFFHSLLAGAKVKAWAAPLLGRGYRLAYNLLSAVQLLAVLAAGHALFGDAPPFALDGAVKIALGAIEIAGWFILFVALSRYDLGQFAGTAALRKDGPTDTDDGPLLIDGLHRYVRHPLYSGLFLVLWGAVWTPFGLATAVFASIYLLIGTAFEERRLLARFGSAYAEYRAHTPAFIPRLIRR